MPDCLLLCENYSAWVTAADAYSKDKNIQAFKRYKKPNHYYD
jgi:hypothetical protein